MSIREEFHAWIQNNGHPVTDAPKVYLEASLLSVAANVVGRQRWIPYGGQRLFPNLWFLLVGPSSRFGKSTSINLGLRLLEQVKPDHLLPNDFSMQSLYDRLAEQPQGLFHLDEWSAWFQHLGRGFMTGAGSVFMQMYERDRPLTIRYKHYSVEVRDMMVNIIGAVATCQLQQVLKPADLHNGLLARFAIVQETEKETVVDFPGTPEQEREDALVESLTELATLDEMEMGITKSAVDFHATQRRAAVAHYDALFPEAEPFIHRAWVNCLKYAMLYHFLSGKLEDPMIDEEDMASAIAFTEHTCASAATVLDNFCLTPYQRFRRSVLAYLRKGERHYNEILAHLKVPTSQLDRALFSLQVEGRVKRYGNRYRCGNT